MKKEKPPETAVGRLMYFVKETGAFLHPRITDALEKLVWEARSEMAQEAKDQKISRELQELEPLLDNFRTSMKVYGTSSNPRSYLFHMRPILKKIIELYGTQP